MASRMQMQLMRTRLSAAIGRRGLLSFAVLAFVFLAPALAHAHGSMSSDELGPPLFTSGLLGFVSYWIVLLWPSSRKKDDSKTGVNPQNGGVPQPQRRKSKSVSRVKRRPHLRVVEPGEQLHIDQQARRKASDG